MNMLIIDDHTLFREGFRLLLTTWNPAINFLQADNCENAVEQFKEDAENIELIFLDLNLVGASNSNAVELIGKHFPIVPVALLTASEDRHNIDTALSKGAIGYIPKHIHQKQLIEAVESMLAGKRFIFGLPEVSVANKHIDMLSTRQKEIIKCLAVGKPNKVIARELEISENTVRVHLNAIYQLLDVKNRTEAAHLAIASGILA